MRSKLFTKQLLFPHPNPPLRRERRVESWTPNTTFLKDYIPFSRPSFFLKKIQSGPAAAASGTTFRLRWFLRPSPAAPSPSPRRRKETRGALATTLVDGEAE